MKQILKFLFASILMFSSSFAQSINVKKVNDSENSKAYKVDAHQFLAKEDEKVAKFLKENPNYFKDLKLKKAAAWNFTVGSTKSWFSYNFKTSSYFSVPSTCQAIGTHCYIFVEDAIWNTKVTSANVSEIMNAFDNSTPANPNKGVYETDVQTFGNPPDVDNDPKIIILIMDIKDNYDGDQNKSYVAGYFSSLNEIKEVNSNNAEIYYLDANPSVLSTTTGLADVMSTTAHEFQHMINFNYHDGTAGNPVQTTFLNEGCSLVAEVVCGYPIYSQSLYNSEYNHYLLDWRTGTDNVLYDYSRAARYMTYMYEQFGVEFLQKLVQDDWVGTVAVDDALGALSTPTDLRFRETLENWFSANAINMKSVDPAWGYTTQNVNTVSPLIIANPNSTSGTITVEKSAADYISFTNGKNLSIQFDNKGLNGLVFKAFKYDASNNVTVQNIDANTQYDFTDFGTTTTKITFGIYNTNPSRAFDYSYTSTGEASIVTLAYDQNEPTGVLTLSDQDTVCVVFDGVTGGQLDSIKVALRQAGTVYGGLYEYTGTLRPSPLGKKLADLNVTSTIAVKPPVPYPVPWTNWVNVDLTSQNIDASQSFVAAFLVEGTYPENNRIMITEQPNTNNHSYTYLHEPSSGASPDWFYVTASDTSVYAYLVRAYVGFGITAVEDQVAESVPSKFNLDQNYPNPFNPSTIINFSLPENGNVELSIYNSLGEKVKTLINQEMKSGLHTINFNGAGLTSGIYYYRLTSNNNVLTKKMLLMK